MHLACTRSRLASLVALALAACNNDVIDPGEDDTGAGSGGTTQADGTTAGTSAADTGAAALRPNWHEDIAPLVHASCTGCHREGGIAPFSLETYALAEGLAPLLGDTVVAGTMPPWGALETDECQPQHRWKDDLRLTDAEKQLFIDWAAEGAPEGDPAKAAPLPTPPSLELADPTLTLQNPAPFTVGGKQDSFICVAIDPAVDKDVWITGVQMVPDNAKVVHHVLVYVDRMATSDGLVDANSTFPCEGFVSFDGAMQIATWVPGAVPTETPPEIGFPMPAGSRIVLAYHYHPTGAGDEVDQSSIALRWTEQKPSINGVMGLFGNGDGLEPGPNDPNGVPVFHIPANVADHTETMSVTIPDWLPKTPIFSLGTHMHYVGVDMRMWIERGGQEQCLIHTPRWDFNWQRNYTVDAPVADMPYIQGGDIVRIKCKFDNTLGNPFLVKALAEQGLSEPIDVELGESSLDEMCLLLFGLATDLPIDNF